MLALFVFGSNVTAYRGGSAAAAVALAERNISNIEEKIRNIVGFTNPSTLRPQRTDMVARETMMT